MIELVFAIVVMGIIGKFGVEFLAQSYRTFIQAKINNELHANSANALQFIAKRLESRIQSSVIKRSPNLTTVAFQGATEIPLVDDASYNVLEWISYDIDGYRGTTAPLWSGIADLDPSVTTVANIFSPDTNTTAVNTLIQTLSYNTGTTIANAAIMFSGESYNPNSFGWDGGDPLTDQTKAIHPINAATINTFSTGIGTNFSGMKISNRYMLAWTAYALVHDTTTNTLTLYYDYQPWEGDAYGDANTKKAVLMENVSTFRIKTNPSGGIFSLMVCAKSDLIVGEEHSICKEKVIF
jgi:hypothetical protein